MAALEELEREYEKAKRDPKFKARLDGTANKLMRGVRRRCFSRGG